MTALPLQLAPTPESRFGTTTAHLAAGGPCLGLGRKPTRWPSEAPPLRPIRTGREGTARSSDSVTTLVHSPQWTSSSPELTVFCNARPQPGGRPHRRGTGSPTIPQGARLPPPSGHPRHGRSEARPPAGGVDAARLAGRGSRRRSRRRSLDSSKRKGYRILIGVDGTPTGSAGKRKAEMAETCSAAVHLPLGTTDSTVLQRHCSVSTTAGDRT